MPKPPKPWNKLTPAEYAKRAQKIVRTRATKAAKELAKGPLINSVELLRPQAGDIVMVGVAVEGLSPEERADVLARVSAFFERGLPEGARVTVYNTGDLTVKVVRP